MNVQNNPEQKKPSLGNKILGSAAGWMGGNATVIAANTCVSLPVMKNINKINEQIMQDAFESEAINLKQVLINTGLSEKGVEIIRATSKNESTINELIKNDFNKGIGKLLPKRYKDIKIKSMSNEVKNGINAFFSITNNKIIIPEKGMEFSAFHEIGHALNANKGKLSKILQNCRPLALLSIPIMLIAVLKTKKTEDEKPKNKIDKATTFIKENAGILSFSAFIPTLLEEGLATIKGNKLAKEFLDSGSAKKIAKANGLAYLTYFGTAVGYGIGATLATKIKDAITKNKTNKTQEK